MPRLEPGRPETIGIREAEPEGSVSRQRARALTRADDQSVEVRAGIGLPEAEQAGEAAIGVGALQDPRRRLAGGEAPRRAPAGERAEIGPLERGRAAEPARARERGPRRSHALTRAEHVRAHAGERREVD